MSIKAIEVQKKDLAIKLLEFEKNLNKKILILIWIGFYETAYEKNYDYVNFLKIEWRVENKAPGSHKFKSWLFALN